MNSNIEAVTVIALVFGLAIAGATLVDEVWNQNHSDYYDSKCEQRFGEDWVYMDTLAEPNLDKDTTTILCSRDGWLSGGERVIEVEPYPG